MSVKDIPGIMSPIPLKDKCPECVNGVAPKQGTTRYMCEKCKGTGWLDKKYAEPWGV